MGAGEAEEELSSWAQGEGDGREGQRGTRRRAGRAKEAARISTTGNKNIGLL
jgi:hypothetical protein